MSKYLLIYTFLGLSLSSQSMQRKHIYAGFWPRLMAHNIDLMVLLPIYYVGSLFIVSNTFLLSLCVIFTFCYEVIFDCSDWGGTPGKKIMKIKIIDRSGKSINLKKSLIRSISKMITVGTLFIGYLVIILRPDKKGIHDLIAGSQVIFTTSN